MPSAAFNHSHPARSRLGCTPYTLFLGAIVAFGTVAAEMDDVADRAGLKLQRSVGEEDLALHASPLPYSAVMSANGRQESLVFHEAQHHALAMDPMPVFVLGAMKVRAVTDAGPELDGLADISWLATSTN